MSTPIPPQTAVQYSYGGPLPDVLEQLGSSLLITTYQAGQLVTAGVRGGRLTFSFNQFEQVMGLAAAPPRLAVGAKRQVWLLLNAPELGPHVGEVGTHDACYLARSCRLTGEVHGHEMAFGPEGLWLVNTLFSCLCLVSEECSFVPRWHPPFISKLAAEDRCHLNGMAMENGRPRFVTAMAETDTPAGWRPGKASSGCLIGVSDGAVITRGLCMPHSPRLVGGRLWVLDSGRGAVALVDLSSGGRADVVCLPGYTRGLAIAWPHAFVGLSRIRETSVFGGIPIAEKREELKCGVSLVNLQTGREEGRLEFSTGVEEIFDVQLLSGSVNPFIAGPLASASGQGPIWVVPPALT